MMKNKITKKKCKKIEIFSFPPEMTLNLRSQIANENAIQPLESWTFPINGS